MNKIIRLLLILTIVTQSACSTAGGMYTSGDPVNGDFSVWKTAGAVLLGVLTLGAIGVGAYAGASNNHGTTYASSDEPVFVSGDSYHRTYYYRGHYINCYRTGTFVNCY